MNDTEWLKNFNSYIKFKNPERKVCLIVDNASSHKHVELSNVVVKFFALNLVKFLFEKIENFNEFKLPELNDTIRMIRKAWNDVLVTTIVRCWDHFDILSTKNKPLESSDYLDKTSIESQCNLNLDEVIDRFKTKYFEYNKDRSDKFDSAAEFVNLEESESTNEELSDYDIIRLVLGKEEVESVTETTEPESLRSVFRDVLNSLEVIQKYTESSKSSEKMIDLYDKFKVGLNDLKNTNLDQVSICNYFKKID
ncbi:unnamed protein product [Brachionus calyciflorus]|uniref:DDE-1 domain-containing protein n=1 Tax=Brachionus calyciflorus TaxID=104777 RepID=A0A814J9Q0_9BILA|nr:unnamed protein product [Brachionus calyciflorus]